MIRTAQFLALSVLAAFAVGCGGGDAGSDTTMGGEEAEAPGMTMASLGIADVCVTSASPEQLAERPSPLRSTSTTIGGAEVTVCYGSPSANGREIMGGLVPMDAPWRFGANEATTIHTPVALDIGGVAVEPGSYSLYAVPGEESWEVFVNAAAERWGIPIDESVKTQDVGSFQVQPEATDAMVESLAMDFEPVDGGAHLVVAWENTRVRIPVSPAEG